MLYLIISNDGIAWKISTKRHVILNTPRFFRINKIFISYRFTLHLFSSEIDFSNFSSKSNALWSLSKFFFFFWWHHNHFRWSRLIQTTQTGGNRNDRYHLNGLAIEIVSTVFEMKTRKRFQFNSILCKNAQIHRLISTHSCCDFYFIFYFELSILVSSCCYCDYSQFSCL